MSNLKSQKHVSKSSHFPINFDSSMSTNIGEFLPTGIFELTPHTKVNGNIKSGARLAPMVNPTFGKCSIYDYVVNMKLNDIYPIYNDLISQNPIVGNTGDSFIPSSVPSFYLNELYCNLLCYSEYAIYVKVQGTLGEDLVLPLHHFFPYYLQGASGSTPNPLITQNKFISDFIFHTIHDHMPSKAFDGVGSRFSTWNTVPNVDSAFTTLVDADGCPPASAMRKSLNGLYVYALDSKTNVNLENADYSLFVSDLYCGNYNQYESGSSTFKAQSLKSLMTGETWNAMTEDLYGSRYNSTNILGFYIGFNLNYYGKRLRKVLNGLGYHPSVLADMKSALPLIGYYKFWFDTCNPKRNITYNDTICARYFDYISRSSAQPICEFYLDSLYDISKQGICFSAFLRSLCDLSYSTPHNFITLCRDISDTTPNPFDFHQSIQPAATEEYNNNTIQGAGSSNFAPGASYYDNGDYNGFVAADGSTLTSEGLNLLQRFTQYINSKRFVPQSVKDFMMSKFGVSVPNDSYIVSVQKSELYFDDVFQTSTTAEGYLGEYAGRSQGSGSKAFNFSTDEASYLMIISVVIPRTQFVQGQNSLVNRIQPLDFYNADFDGLTMQQIPETSVFCPSSVVDSSKYVSSTPDGVNPELSATFGVLPIYETYKLSPCGVLSGDLNLRSSRNTYAGFTLDSLIYDGDTILSPYSASGSDLPQYVKRIKFDSVSRLPLKLFSSQAWRFVSPDNGRNNLQRIFVTANYTSNGFFGESKKMLDDTIVLHHIFNFNLNSYMLPSSHSYQTFDLCELESNSARDVSLN